MYTVSVAMKIPLEMANIIDMVDGTILKGLEQKVEVDGNITCLKHRIGRAEMRTAVIEE